MKPGRMEPAAPAARGLTLRWLALLAPGWALVFAVMWFLVGQRPLPAWLGGGLVALDLRGQVILMGVLLMVAVVYQRKVLVWSGQQPAWEPVANAGVWRLLRRPEFSRALLPGEKVREALLLAGMPPRCLVLVPTRLLVFTVTPQGLVMERSIARSDFERVALHPPQALSWRSRMRLLGACGAAWLQLDLRGGETLQGPVPSAVTARRLVQLLGQSWQVGAAGLPTPAAQPSSQRESAAMRGEGL